MFDNGWYNTKEQAAAMKCSAHEGSRPLSMNDMPVNPSSPYIILITGNMASGKSSVAQALAERLPKS